MSERRDSFLRVALAGALLSSPVTVPAALAQQSLTPIEEVVVVGSRRAGRTATESPVPVDVLSGEDFDRQGSSDMDDLLRNLLPSYNVTRQPISDAATLTRPANLRGLPPDDTLILINGKRRHRAAVIAELGGSLSAGSQGPDLSMIPPLALQRVEVLRDGAAAQYGSDAIAGVINFVLKDDPSGFTIEGKYGEFMDSDTDDGQLRQLAGNLGVPLGPNGFANMTLQWSDSEPTGQNLQRSDAQGLIDTGLDAVAQPYAQIWGQPEIKDNWAFFLNSGIQVSDTLEVYGFGNYGERKVDGGFFYRNPNDRSGVFTGGSSVWDANGNGINDDTETIGLRAVMDTSMAGQGGPSGCPAVPTPGGSVYDGFTGSGYGSSNPGCFVFNAWDEGGFTPRFGADKITDISGVLGFRGTWDQLLEGLEYDVSVRLGQNEVEFYINNTLNPSLGPQSPRNFNLGKYVQTEQGYNIDFVYPYANDWFASDLNVAFGLEYRVEKFEIRQGDRDSWFAGPYAFQGSNGLVYGSDVQYDVNGDGTLDTVFTGGEPLAGLSIGANGFAGFGPEQVGDWDRGNWAGYVDLETDIIDPWTVSAAVRYEKFEDFGSTWNWKLATRYAITPDIAVRGSMSTGFRAPTPGQANVTKVSTITVDGVLQQRGQIPPTNPVAEALGGKALQEENANNFTLGGSWNVMDDLTVTVDWYYIELKERISQTGTIEIASLDINDFPNLVSQCPGITDVPTCLQFIGVPGAADLTSVSFFTNDFTTTTKGVDLIATYTHDWGDWGMTNFTAAWNYTETNVDKAGQATSRDRVIDLENFAPENRGIFTVQHMWRDLSLLFRGSYYDDWTVGDWSDDPSVIVGTEPDGTPIINNKQANVDCQLGRDKCYSGEWIFDAEASYTFRDHYTVVLGAQNIFDEKGPVDDDNKSGTIGSGNHYDTSTPWGFDGGFWYLRLRAEF